MLFKINFHLPKLVAPTIVFVFLKLRETCCKFPVNSVDKVVGGANVDITEVPYMLALFMVNKYICGASIISEHWFVTAAHCTKEIVDGHLSASVRSGSSNRSKGGVVHNVTKIIPHESYDPKTGGYDLAVGKVCPPFVYSATTRPVILPKRNYPIDIKFGLVTGWGNDEPWSFHLPETLKCTIVPYVDKQKCIEDYAPIFEITPQNLCYGYRDKRKDSCEGDSGGPLVNKDGILIGIVAWGLGCAQPGYPGVYTNVIALYKWIKEKTQN